MLRMETNRDLSGSTKILSVGGLLLLSGGMSSFPVTICLMSQDLTCHMDTKVYGGMCVYIYLPTHLPTYPHLWVCVRTCVVYVYLQFYKMPSLYDLRTLIKHLYRRCRPHL